MCGRWAGQVVLAAFLGLTATAVLARATAKEEPGLVYPFVIWKGLSIALAFPGQSPNRLPLPQPQCR